MGAVKKDTYSKNRLGTGVYEGKGEIKGDEDDIRRHAEHIMGDACTPGNPRECTVESLIPVVKETMVGTL